MLNTIRLNNNLNTTIRTTSPGALKPQNDNQPPTTNKDSFSLSSAVADGSMNLLKAAGRGVGSAASSVGDTVLGVAGRLLKDTAVASVAAAVPAGIAAATFVIAGPAVALAAVGAIGLGAGILHHAVAPPHPEDAGLSKSATKHNRFVDSVCMGSLAACSALIGMVNVPTVGLGIALATTTAAATGALGSVINQSGEALGLLKKATA